jgi:DNA-binding transcriptional LysR family regulator
VLASTDRRGDAGPGPGYIYVDWGPEFFAKHSASFPEFQGAPLTANIGWLGLEHVLQNGGAGYFPHRLVRPHLPRRKLSIVPGAPEFSVAAYLVYPSDSDTTVVGHALASIRRAANRERRRP